MIKLNVLAGRLAIGEELLIYRYRAGDVDCIPWPLVAPYRTEQVLAEQLKSALADEVEIGGLASDTTAVELPDGKEFKL